MDRVCCSSSAKSPLSFILLREFSAQLAKFQQEPTEMSSHAIEQFSG